MHIVGQEVLVLLVFLFLTPLIANACSSLVDALAFTGRCEELFGSSLEILFWRSQEINLFRFLLLALSGSLPATFTIVSLYS